VANSFKLNAVLHVSGPVFKGNNIQKQIQKQVDAATGKIEIKVPRGASRSLGNLSGKLDKVAVSMKNVSDAAATTNDAFAKLQAAAAALNKSTKTIGSNSKKATESLKRTKDTAKQATSIFADLGTELGVTTRRFGLFIAASSALFGLINSFQDAARAAIDFQSQTIKLRQITGRTARDIKGITDEIGRLSRSLGVSSKGLADASRLLAQTGLSARDTRTALQAIAKTDLGPTFKSLEETAEGAIAVFAQFDVQVKDTTKILDTINSVSKKFAVESQDIIDAVRKAGGTFAASNKSFNEFGENTKNSIESFNEFVALFTAVRSTTRESASTIATGIRTITARLQRLSTQEKLQDILGITLFDEGQFIGPVKALNRIRESLSALNIQATDSRAAQVLEAVAGVRQRRNIEPLLFGDSAEKFAKALDAANASAGSVNRDAILAQEDLNVKIAKTQENFLALIREISDTQSFKDFANALLGITNALIEFGRVSKDIIPLLAIFGSAKGFAGLAKLLPAAGRAFKQRSINIGRASGTIAGGPTRFAKGGKVPSLLTPGEIVVGPDSASRIGGDALNKLNRGSDVGVVPGAGSMDTVPAMLESGSFVIRKRSSERILGMNSGGMVPKRFNDGGFADDDPVGKFKRIEPGAYISKNSRVAVERQGDGSWSWSVDNVVGGSTRTLKEAQTKAIKETMRVDKLKVYEKYDRKISKPKRAKRSSPQRRSSTESLRGGGVNTPSKNILGRVGADLLSELQSERDAQKFKESLPLSGGGGSSGSLNLPLTTRAVNEERIRNFKNQRQDQNIERLSQELGPLQSSNPRGRKFLQQFRPTRTRSERFEVQSLIDENERRKLVTGKDLLAPPPTEQTGSLIDRSGRRRSFALDKLKENEFDAQLRELQGPRRADEVRRLTEGIRSGDPFSATKIPTGQRGRLDFELQRFLAGPLGPGTGQGDVQGPVGPNGELPRRQGTSSDTQLSPALKNYEQNVKELAKKYQQQAKDAGGYITEEKALSRARKTYTNLLVGQANQGNVQGPIPPGGGPPRRPGRLRRSVGRVRGGIRSLAGGVSTAGEVFSTTERSSRIGFGALAAGGAALYGAQQTEGQTRAGLTTAGGVLTGAGIGAQTAGAPGAIIGAVIGGFSALDSALTELNSSGAIKELERNAKNLGDSFERLAKGQGSADTVSKFVERTALSQGRVNAAVNDSLSSRVFAGESATNSGVGNAALNFLNLPAAAGRAIGAIQEGGLGLQRSDVAASFRQDRLGTTLDRVFGGREGASRIAGRASTERLAGTADIVGGLEDSGKQIRQEIVSGSEAGKKLLEKAKLGGEEGRGILAALGATNAGAAGDLDFLSRKGSTEGVITELAGKDFAGEVVEELSKLSEEAENLKQALANVAEIGKTADTVNSILGRTSNEFQKLNTSISERLSGIGGARTLARRSGAGQIFASPSAFSGQDINAAGQQLRSSFGNNSAINSLFDEFRAGESIRQIAAESRKFQNLSPDQFQREIDRNVTNSAGGTKTADLFLSALSSEQEGTNIEKLDAALKAISGPADAAGKTLENLAKFSEEYKNTIRDTANELTNLQSQISSNRVQATVAGASSRNQLVSSLFGSSGRLGRRLQDEPVNAQLRVLSGGAQTAGGILANQQSRIAARDEAQARLEANPTLENARQFAQLNNAVGDSSKALQLLASDTTRAGNALSEIQRIQAARERAAGGVSSFLQSDFASRRQQLQGLAAVQRFQAGELPTSDQDIQKLLGGLDSLSQFNADLSQQLRGQFFDKLAGAAGVGGVAFGPGGETVGELLSAEGGKAEQDLRKSLEFFASEQRAALDLLNEATKRMQEIVSERVIAANQTFGDRTNGAIAGINTNTGLIDKAIPAFEQFSKDVASLADSQVRLQVEGEVKAQTSLAGADLFAQQIAEQTAMKIDEQINRIIDKRIEKLMGVGAGNPAAAARAPIGRRGGTP
jgi:TP901 family phage tail tape measure protein